MNAIIARANEIRNIEMIGTTLEEIRSYNPCKSGWEKLLTGLGKTKADDTAVTLQQILDICGIEDALWCLRCWPEHSKAWRRLAVKYARQVQHLMTDQRSIDALDVADRHADGRATYDELAAAREAAEAAAWAAAGAAAWAAAGEAARAAARAAAGAAAGEAAWAAAKKLLIDAVIEL